MISWHQHWVKVRNFIQASSKWNISVLKSYIISSELERPYLASLQGLLSVRANFFSGRGAGMVTPSVLPSPYKQFLRLPTPILRCFWKDFLMTPSLLPHIKYLSPLPPPKPPIKNFNQTLRQCIDYGVLTSKSCHSNFSTTVLLLVFRQGSSKFEFTVKGELTYW